MENKITENTIEEFAIELLEKSGYQYIFAPSIAPDLSACDAQAGSDTPERGSFEDVLLIERLQTVVGRINPEIPEDIREDAIKQVLRLNSPELITNNETFHRMLTEGIKVSYQKDGNDRGDLVWLIDFKNPDNNDFLVTNQFTVIENGVNKRPDIILFVNGLPLVVIELKNPADENATVISAFRQLQTYKHTIPSLFTYNGFMIISDGLEAKAGTISAGLSRFMAWKTSDGKVEASPLIGQLETLIKGMLNKKTLIDIIRHFIVFERTTVQKQPSLNPSHGEGSHYRGGMRFTGMVAKVKELRKNQTEAESVFWDLVRNKKFLGLKFRRQHQIGHYIADFYCHSERLIIEFDGDVHNNPEQKKKDEKRDKYLTSLGNRVLRFKNEALLEDTENVLKRIENSISPSGRDGREGGITTVTTIKKLAYYHQYYAVNRAVESTIRASGHTKSPLQGGDSGVGTRRRILPYNPNLKELAKKLRKNMTLSEVLLWDQLKQKKMLGFDFDRQRPIDEYIVDFYCKDLMLAIEIDGESHNYEEIYENDIKRQKRLESLGVRFLRFHDLDVKKNLEDVLRVIEHWIKEHQNDLVGRVPTPCPSQEGNALNHPSQEGNALNHPSQGGIHCILHPVRGISPSMGRVARRAGRGL